jgi:hypothetical protein
VSDAWRPLSSRLAGDGAAWREEVPAALERPLRDWLDDALSWRTLGFGPDPKIASRVVLRLNLILPNDDGVAGGNTTARRYLVSDTPVETLPDIVDAALHLLPDPDPKSPSMEHVLTNSRQTSLRRLLDDSLSVLRVRRDGRGLERRADVMTEAAFGEAVKSAEAAPAAGSAGSHLRAAWGAVYSFRPDPVKAYSEAIKAVEAAASSVAEPGNSRATLGTMLRQLRDHPERFSLAIGGQEGSGDISPLIGMLRLLWEGQSSRHGSSSPTRDETLEEATMAVDLAVMLVRWFTTGAVRRSA